MNIRAVLLGAVLGMSAPSVLAQTDLDATINYRQGVFRAMEWNLTRLAAMVQGRVAFAADEFTQRAERLLFLSRLPEEAFTDPASGRGDRVETRASWQIWEAKPHFDDLMGEMQTRLMTLNEAASQGQGRKQLRPLLGRVAQSCKACHDKFRE